MKSFLGMRSGATPLNLFRLFICLHSHGKDFDRPQEINSAESFSSGAKSSAPLQRRIQILRHARTIHHATKLGRARIGCQVWHRLQANVQFLSQARQFQTFIQPLPARHQIRRRSWDRVQPDDKVVPLHLLSLPFTHFTLVVEGMMDLL